MKTAATFTFILIINCLFAQPFEFSMYKAPYQPLSNANNLWNNVYFDYLTNNPNFQITLPWKFKYPGYSEDNRILVRNNGTLSSIAVEGLFMNSFYVNFSKLKSIRHNDSIISKIHYNISGSAPNRILKVEYKHVGFDFEDVDSSYFTNFQIWFYENGNKIEYRYGSSKTKPECWFYGKGPYIGTDTMNQYGGYFLKGDPNNPEFIATNDTQLDRNPDSGTVYVFTPKTTFVNKYFLQNHIYIYPNPAKTHFNISGLPEGTSIEVQNMLGKTVLIETNYNGEAIPVNNLPAGLYLVKLTFVDGSNSIVRIVIE